MRIVFASGKGGAGKTTVTASLAALWPRPVVAVDCDVEAPNLHLFLSPELPTRRAVTLDVPLLPQGEELARRVGATLPAVEHIYRSPLQRCRRTAELLWPGVEMTVVDELRESDFGPFEGKNHEELKDDPLYQAWLGMGDRPNFAAMPVGESAQQVTDRVSIGLEKTAADAARRGFGRVGVVSHGGALMALLAKYGRPERDYYGWMCPNCGGFRAELNPDTLELTILEEYRGEKGL